MTHPAATELEQRFHRYVAVLFAVTFPMYVIVEMSSGETPGSLTTMRWSSYILLAVWAIWLTQRETVTALFLVTTTTWFFAALSLIEAAFAVDVSPFDDTTTFGLLMMLGVLIGVLSSARRLIWVGTAALSIAVWSVLIGMFRHERYEVVAVRVLVAVVGVAFTAAVVSKLYAQLLTSIARYQRATRLQSAIAACSEALLVQSGSGAVNEALKALLDATEADYVYVDRNREVEGRIHWEIVAEARRREVLPSGGWLSGVYADGSPTFRALRSNRASVVYTADLTGEERVSYQRDGILSEAVVPIFVENEFRGAIGFVEYTRDREWASDEVETLWRASHMIAAYWRRQEDEEKLRALNESKDRLLASVSHEIRTPLTAIVGLAEEIIASPVDMTEAEMSELSGIIAVQSRELAELVEDLLVASRAELGSLSIAPRVMDLRAEVESVARGIRESHRTHKTIDVSGRGLSAWADPLRCRQIVRNLLTNAIRYGGDHIQVILRECGETAQVVVLDDGDGVPASDGERIFERYYRSRQSPTQPGSVGIGLAVSRQLAEMMDGRLVYVPGTRGARFELSLPRSGVREESAGEPVSSSRTA